MWEHMFSFRVPLLIVSVGAILACNWQIGDVTDVGLQPIGP